MKRFTQLFTFTLLLSAGPALAHVGPEAMDTHFIEHMVLALVIGLPAGFALVKLATGSTKRNG